MGLLRHYLRGEIAEIHRNGVRLRVIGQRARLAPDIVTLIENGEGLTRNNTGLQLTIALSYGGGGQNAVAARPPAREAGARGGGPPTNDQEGGRGAPPDALPAP